MKLKDEMATRTHDVDRFGSQDKEPYVLYEYLVLCRWKLRDEIVFEGVPTSPYIFLGVGLQRKGIDLLIVLQKTYLSRYPRSPCLIAQTLTNLALGAKSSLTAWPSRRPSRGSCVPRRCTPVGILLSCRRITRSGFFSPTLG